MPDKNAAFGAAVAKNYDQYLGPMLFEPYARDLAARLHVNPGESVLETAAGTGIVTRHLRSALAPAAKLVATDLNEGMLECAKQKFKGGENVEFKVADAMQLPFPEQSFGAVACQFGVMFFPDKTASFREVRRVLKPQGSFLFSVWDALEHNHIPQTVHQTLERLFPENPPTFYQVPFSCHQIDSLRSSLSEAGFTHLEIAVVPFQAQSPSARDATLGFVMGNPVSQQIAERGSPPLEQVLEQVESTIAEAHGKAPVQGKMRAIVFKAKAP